MKFIDRFKRQGRPAPTASGSVGQAPLLFALEPRIMFDASVAVVAQEATAEPAKDTAKDTATADHGEKAAVATADATSSGASQRHEVVFVDGQISNPQDALKGLPAGSEVVVLDPSKDGLKQMADYLKGRNDLDAIHVLSHGASGTVQLGNVWLDSTNLAEHGEALQSIGQALKADGDLMLYGCKVGKDAAGQAFVSQLAGLTGADVGASIDDTGANALGGNWTLERSSGQLETASLALNDYQGLLVTSWNTGTAPLTGTPITTPGRVVVGDFDNDGDTDILYQTVGNGSAWAYARSNGDGTFTLQTQAQSPFSAVVLPDHTGTNYYVADFDGDGDVDVLSGINGTTGTYLRNDGGTFSTQSSASFPAPLAAGRMLVGDFDNDGDVDILYQTGGNGTTFGFARNNGSGVFTLQTQAQSPFSAVVLPDHLGNNYFAGDIDGDGDLDILASTNNTTGAYLRNDNGVFSTQSTATFPAPAAAGRVLLADFDSDGDADILYQTGGNGSAWAYARSNGDGTFTLQTLAQSPLAGVSLVDHSGTSYRIGDFDGDGDIDLYGGVANSAGNLYVQNDRPPIIVTSTPSDNGLNVDPNANIVLTFNESVAKGGSGNIYIVRTSDNVVVETIAIGSSQITGAGTTWTIDPSITLALGTGYAIRFDSKTFVDGEGAIFKGVKDNTTLNFTTRNNLAPVVGNLGGDSTVYTEGGSPLVIDAGGNATVTDADSTDFNGGNVTVAIITNRVAGEDLLGIRNEGNGAGQIGVSGSNVLYAGTIIGTFAGGSGANNLVITLNANANAAAVQALVRNLTYSNANNADIATAARTVRVTVNDGDGGTSSNADINIAISPLNDAPTLTATGGTPTFTEDGSAVDLFSGVTVSTVEAGQNIKQITFTVTNVVDAGFERLTIDGTTFLLTNGASGITLTNGLTYSVSFSGSTATVTLSSGGGISAAATAGVVDGMAYSNLSQAPSTGVSRVVTLTSIEDTGGTSNGGVDTSVLAISATVTVVAVNDAPTLSGGPFALPGTDEDTLSAGQLVSSILAGLTRGDVDTGALSGIAVTGASGSGTWQYSTDGTTWTSFGLVSISNGLLLSSTSQVRFVPDGANGGNASLTFRAWDQTSGAASTNGARSVGDTSVNGGTTAYSTGTAQAQLTVTSVNDAPVLTPGAPILPGIGDGQVNNAGQTVGSFANGGISDVDSGAVTGIAITGTLNGTGTWQYSLDGTTWSDIGTVAGNSALLLRSTDKVRFVPDGVTGTSASLTFKAWDQTGATAGQQGTKADATVSGGTSAFSTASDSASILVTAVNDAPTLTTSNGSAGFVEGNNTTSTPVVIDANLTISDSDNTTFVQATVAITGNLQVGQDVLAFTANPAITGDITGSYNPLTGVMTLSSASGTATTAQWQAALHSVTYTNTSDAPNTATRTVSFIINDGQLNSLAASRTVTVTAVDDSPLLTAPGTISLVEDTSGALTGISISDADSGTATVTFTVASGSLLATSGSGVTVGGSAGARTLSGSVASINAFIAAGKLTYTPDANANGSVSLGVSVDTGSVSVASGSVNLQIAAVNDAPQIITPGSISFTEDTQGYVTGVSFNDVDAGSGAVTVNLSVPGGVLSALSGNGVTVGGTGTGALVLTGSIADINAFIAANGVSYSPAANANGNVVLSVQVNDGGNTGSGGALTANTTMILAIAAVNDAPVINLPVSLGVSQDSNLTFNSANGSLISLNDVDAGSGAISVTLTVSHGTLTLSGTSGLMFQVGSGAGDATMTFIGSQSDINAALNGMVFTPTAGYNGSVALQMAANDQGNSGSGGAQSIIENRVITVAPLNPRVTSVSSSSGNGSYKVGDTITVVVTFDQSVQVDSSGGTPSLLLETGLIDRNAVYVSGSGSNSLVFNYVVQAGDVSADLNYASTTGLALNGATIRSVTADDAVLNLPTAGSGNSLADQKAIVIDGIAPVINSVGVPANGTYALGQNLDFTLNLSEVVSVWGSPRLEITLDNGGTVFAEYVSGSGTSALVFRLTVATGQLDSNGISVGSNLVLNGGSITDVAGNTATGTLSNVGNTSAVLVDGVVPVVATVDVPANGVYRAGDVLNFTVNTSESVVVSTAGGTPRLAVDVGGVIYYANYVSGSGTGTLVFQYVVQAGSNDGNGLQAAGTLDLNGGSVNDAAGNQLTLALNGLGSTAGVLVDTAAPTVGGVVAIDASPSNAGSVRYTLTFNETVSGVDISDFNLNFTGTASGTISSVTSLDGRTYTVLVSALGGVGSLRLDLNASGTGIVDAAGNALAGGQTGAVYQIDRVAPSVSNVSVPANGTYVAGQHLDFTVNLDEAVLVDTTGGTPRLQITLDTGGTVYADYLSGSGSNALVFRLTVSSGQLDSNGISVGAGLDLNGAVVRDSIGNNVNTALNNVAGTTGVLVDAVIPTVAGVTVPQDGSYNAGDVLTFTVNASESVLVDTSTGTPRLTLTIGGVTRYATYVSGSGTGQLVFAYTIQSGNNDADGIQVASTLDLNGASVRDAAGNNLNLALNIGNLPGVLVDTVAPQVADIVRVDVSPTNSGSVRYTVTFDESVNGVDSADFALVFSGTAAGRISSVTRVDGRTYSVLVDNLAGVGTVRLDLNGVGTGISDAAGNTIGGGLEGSAYSIDRVAPSVTGVDVPRGGTYVAGQGLDFTVHLSEAVLVDTGDGLPRLAITLDNGRVAYADYVSGSGSNALVFRLTISNGHQAANGVGVASTIDLNGGTLRDARGNDAQTGLNNMGNVSGIVIDARAPRPVDIVLDGPASSQGPTLSFTLTFDEAVSGVDANDFSVLATGSASGSVQSVVQLDAHTYRVTVGGVNGQGNLGLSLNALGSGIRDAAGNALAVSLAGPAYQVRSQDAGDPLFRVTTPAAPELTVGQPLQPQVFGAPLVPSLSPLVPAPLFEQQTLGNGLDTLGKIFIQNGLSAPSFIAQVFASSDAGDGSGNGFLGFGGGDGGVFGTSTFAGLFARDVPQDGGAMRVFDGKQWRTTDPAQGLRAVFGAASLGQQLQDIKDAEQRPLRELAMALAQPTEIGNRT
ncbi:DUF4347 domain-containing protein [Pseudomonas fontis]|uniref:DUF4347 domain-containing protein n=1 Tax=Pseudomonas fontis TaxID=2942633 RepID=A0ABT5NYY1_9PSED|nr:DUF4347 domain-containing protein [Pseudomonas fontis]MDD0977135.1 DUF4347 domain-containing protein [Pseudomonas fontis]MDD0993398.1 DUF4347 domain-containing protein [Pseudomonas fontis]